MTVDPDAPLPEFTRQYQAAHDGRDPFTDAWPWAEAIVRWHREYPEPVPGRRFVLTDDPVACDHLTTAVAESLRLSMAWMSQPLGDLDLDPLRGALKQWLKIWGEDGLGPGTPGWPAPGGPYADRWHALMMLIREHPDRWELIRQSLRRALDSLLWHAAPRPHLADEAHQALFTYRLNESERHIDYRSLGEVAPSLGMSPVPVRDSRWYQGYGLVVTEQPL